MHGPIPQITNKLSSKINSVTNYLLFLENCIKMNMFLSGGGPNYCQSLASASLYSAPPCKLDRVESLYGGTKSLYAKSPPLTRANLNRSQSVYTKSSGCPPIVHRGDGKNIFIFIGNFI